MRFTRLRPAEARQSLARAAALEPELWLTQWFAATSAERSQDLEAAISALERWHRTPRADIPQAILALRARVWMSLEWDELALLEAHAAARRTVEVPVWILRVRARTRLQVEPLGAKQDLLEVERRASGVETYDGALLGLALLELGEWAAAGDVHDPEFRKVVDILFSGTDRRAKPYEGVSTFLDAPFRPDAAKLDGFGGLDVALIGVPMDLGVTNRPGARFGPRAVRQVERIGPYHEVHRIVPASAVKMADVGDVPFRSRYSLADSHEDIEGFYERVRAAGVAPASVGGDHSITLPILKALGRDRPLGLIHIDVHADVNDTMFGEKIAHGTPFRRCVEEGLLDGKRVAQIGLRATGYTAEDFDWPRRQGFRVVQAEECWHRSLTPLMAELREQVGGGPVYFSFDIDGLDPSYAGGTGTPEIAGLTTPQALEIIRGCRGLDIVGGDLVEVAPPYDPTGNTSLTAANMLFEMLCVLPGVEYRR